MVHEAALSYGSALGFGLQQLPELRLCQVNDDSKKVESRR